MPCWTVKDALQGEGNYTVKTTHLSLQFSKRNQQYVMNNKQMADDI